MPLVPQPEPVGPSAPVYAGSTDKNTPTIQGTSCSTLPNPPLREAGVPGSGTAAAEFDGTLEVNGDAHVTGTLTAKVDVVLGADCAEDFDVTRSTEVKPGTVMVLADNGDLRPSQDAYDRKVAGVISGAGECHPSMILGRSSPSNERMPLALVGKAYCRADAQYGSIQVGDQTTSIHPVFAY